MKKKELIDALSKYSDDMEVVVFDINKWISGDFSESRGVYVDFVIEDNLDEDFDDPDEEITPVVMIMFTNEDYSEVGEITDAEQEPNE